MLKKYEDNPMFSHKEDNAMWHLWKQMVRVVSNMREDRRVYRRYCYLKRKIYKDRIASPIKLSIYLEQVVDIFAVHAMDIITNRLALFNNKLEQTIIDSSCYVEQEIGLHGEEAKIYAAQLIDVTSIMQGVKSNLGEKIAEELSDVLEGLDDLQNAEVRRQIIFQLTIFISWIGNKQ